MTAEPWPIKNIAVTSLHLDTKNPRLGRETTARAPREIIDYLFKHDKAMDVAQSIATRGYFQNEPLLAVKEDGKFVVVEGNRRLSALKVLREPGLLDGAAEKQVERLVRLMNDPNSIRTVPVVIAPNRHATDRLVAGRHIGTPVMAWQAENRASFILDKLAEGYTNERLQDDLGFSSSDIQEARQVRAIADMARSLDLPDEVRAKLDSPRTSVFTTIGRVFDSSVGRKYLMVQPDTEHGIRGTTTKSEFVKGFRRLVTDVALKNQDSRKLNKNEDIENYFESWDAAERPAKRRGSFIPADIVTGKSIASTPPRVTTAKKKVPGPSATVIPSSFKVRYGSERLKDIRKELVSLKRVDKPNAGAVLLRVFLELSIVDYLKRADRYDALVKRLRAKNAMQPGADQPTMKQLADEITTVAHEKLPKAQAQMVAKALTQDRSAPFNVSDLHAFVHRNEEFPGENDIRQFWSRTQPLFELMLMKDVDE
ncbi:hypothetical protein EG829_15190 [bacterium]|nr:hypothetical protein [bacterium]